MRSDGHPTSLSDAAMTARARQAISSTLAPHSSDGTPLSAATAPRASSGISVRSPSGGRHARLTLSSRPSCWHASRRAASSTRRGGSSRSPSLVTRVAIATTSTWSPPKSSPAPHGDRQASLSHLFPGLVSSRTLGGCFAHPMCYTCWYPPPAAHLPCLTCTRSGVRAQVRR